MKKIQFLSMLLQVLLGAVCCLGSLMPPERPATFPLARPQAVGRVVAWGNNQYGQTTVSGLPADIVAIAAGGYFDRAHSVALRADGTVLVWGSNGDGQLSIPEGLTNVVAIAAGLAHSLALREDGTVVAWGLNGYGQCTVPEGLGSVVAIAAGYEHSLAIRQDGSVVAWGRTWDFGQTRVPDGLTNVVAVCAGEQHSVALKGDGSIVVWGGKSSQTNVPVGLSKVVTIAAGRQQTIAIKSDGTVVAWGQSAAIKNATNAIAAAAGAAFSVVLKANRTVIAWGDNSKGQLVIPSTLNGVLAVAAAYDHALALVSPLMGVRDVNIRVSRVIVEFNAIIGRKYQFQKSGELSEWSAVDPLTTATSEKFFHEFEVGDSSGYYRIVELP